MTEIKAYLQVEGEQFAKIVLITHESTSANPSSVYSISGDAFSLTSQFNGENNI